MRTYKKRVKSTKTKTYQDYLLNVNQVMRGLNYMEVYL